MPGLPIPSGKGTGGRATKVVRQSNNAVTPVDARNIEVIGPNGKRMSLRQLQEWLRDDPNAFANDEGGSPSFHKHDHGDTHIHVTVQAAPEPQLPEKTYGQQAAQLGASAAAGAAMLPFRFMLWMWKQQRQENERAKQREHEIHLARLKVREQRERRDRFNNSVNYLVSHLIGFGGFIVIAIIVIVIMVSTPRWNYVPWGGWWEYPPPPPPHYRDYRGYEQVR